MDDELKAEFRTIVDAAIKENLAEIVGTEVAEKVQETISRVRLQSAIEGRDIIGVDDETKKAFVADIRAIARGEKAAYLESSDATGGYLVPTEVHAGILRIAETVGLIPSQSRRWSMGSDELEIPRYTGSAMQGEYVGEDEEGDETQSDLGIARLHAKTWMLIFRIGNTLLADANVNIADWLMAMAAEGLAYRIDREGFVGGTYAGSPFVGLLQSSEVTVQTLGSGKTGFEDIDPLEAATAIATIPTAGLGKAGFFFSPTVWAQIKGKKDATSGLYEFSQQNSTLMRFFKENGLNPVGIIEEYPVFTTPVLPAYSASAISTKFGVFANLELALAWGDRGPMEVAKSDSATVGGKSVFRANQTAVRFTHRHAVAIQLPAAAVVFKTAAS
jgi:HK97 family phage major capsid protein